ncbi:serine hydrolase domain-containing protein, partial [Bacteroidota bacterium]
MRKQLIAIITLALLLSNYIQNVSFADDRFEEVRKKVNKLINDGKVSSMSIAVAKDGKIIWEEAFGWSDLENKVRATPHTKYRSGSIAKTITATGLMTLVEKGQVELDKPILDYIPHVKIRSFVGAEKEITVRHIVNHRSGMPSYCELFFEDNTEGPRDFLETINRYGIFTFTPGWSYIYSNLGYELIAYLISEVSGLDYSWYINENVFLPLGMMESKVHKRGSAIDQIAICYTPDFKPIPDYWASYPGASDIYFSAHDLIRFAMFHLKDHLKGQKAILSDETIDKMQEAYPPSNTRYGIGWNFYVNDAGYRSVHHGGEGPGSDNFMRLIPSEDIALVILCNNEIGNTLGEIQEEICTALIPDFNKPEETQEETQTEQSDSQEQKMPEGFLGRWKGEIVAYDREIEVELRVTDTEGARIILSEQKESKVDLAVVTDNFLLVYFPGTIPTPDGKRHPDKIRLALVRQGDRISGQATVDHWVEERQI